MSVQENTSGVLIRFSDPYAILNMCLEQVLMDVGGGRGELLSRAMAYAGSHSKGVLLDRQWVLDRCGHTAPILRLVVLVGRSLCAQCVLCAGVYISCGGTQVSPLLQCDLRQYCWPADSMWL